MSLTHTKYEITNISNHYWKKDGKINVDTYGLFPP